MYSCSATFQTLRAPQIGQFREEDVRVYRLVVKTNSCSCYVWQLKLLKNHFGSDVQHASGTLRFDMSSSPPVVSIDSGIIVESFWLLWVLPPVSLSRLPCMQWSHPSARSSVALISKLVQ